MTKTVKTNVPGYVRDTTTGMILNNSQGQYEEYLVRRANIKKLRNVDDEIRDLKNEISELKQLILKVLDK